MTTGADWLDTARRVVDTFLAPPAAPPATSSATGPEAPVGAGTGHADTCRWCPVCQAMAVARGERPEVTAAVADLLTTTAEALRAFAESVPVSEHEATADDGDTAPDRPSGSAPATAADLPEEEPEPTSAVQRIEIA
jgi:hypothetical protein